MTPIILLERLKEFIQANTEDIILPVRPVKNKMLPTVPCPKEKTAADAITHRAAEVHLMRLPDKDAEENRIPYILLQLLTGKDEQLPGEQPNCECKIRIVAAIYSPNDSEGAINALNLITRIRIALLKAGEIGQQFLLQLPLEYLVYPDDTSPYFFAEMMVAFEMPAIHREIAKNNF